MPSCTYRAYSYIIMLRVQFVFMYFMRNSRKITTHSAQQSRPAASGRLCVCVYVYVINKLPQFDIPPAIRQRFNSHMFVFNVYTMMI